MDTKFFILGMPRSGTTYVSTLLNSQKSIKCVGETMFFGRFYLNTDAKGHITKESWAIFKERVSHSNYILNYNDEDNQEFKNIIQNYLLEFRKITITDLYDTISRTFLETSKKKIFIEKTPHHIHYFQRILKYYPNSKFIILYRNPYDFMLSYKNQGNQLRKDIKSTFQDLYNPILCALVWRKYMQSIKKLEKNEKISHIKFKTQELNNEEFLERISNFLNLKVKPLEKKTKINSSTQNLTEQNLFKELSKSDIFWMNLLNKNIMLNNHFQLITTKEIFCFEYMTSIFDLISKSSRYLNSSKNIVGSRIKYYIKYFGL